MCCGVASLWLQTYVRLVTDKLTKHKTVNTSKSSSVQEKFLLAFEICLFQFFFFFYHILFIFK